MPIRRCCCPESLLSQFAKEGIEIARQLLIGRRLGFEERGLRNELLETCAVTGERFPEYDEWLATEKAEKEDHWRRVKELEGDPVGLMKFALEKLTGETMPELPKFKPSSRPVSTLALQQESASKQKVGRNDPCPCRSGKKFKKCCMKKGGI